MSDKPGMEAYEAGVRMAKAVGIKPPRPEAFGLTADDVAEAVQPLSAHAQSILESMQQTTGIRPAEPRKPS